MQLRHLRLKYEGKSGVTHAGLNQVRKPTLDLPLEVRRKMWFKPFMQSYLVVFIGYLTMYLIRKNFNIAQNDMISTYGLSMTQLGMIGLGFSITYGVGKTLVSYYADGKTPNNSCRSC